MIRHKNRIHFQPRLARLANNFLLGLIRQSLKWLGSEKQIMESLNDLWDHCPFS